MSFLVYPFLLGSRYSSLILSRYYSSDPSCNKQAHLASKESKGTNMQQSNDVKVVKNIQRCAENNGKH
jgi:hypothetical protein